MAVIMTRSRYEISIIVCFGNSRCENAVSIYETVAITKKTINALLNVEKPLMEITLLLLFSILLC